MYAPPPAGRRVSSAKRRPTSMTPGKGCSNTPRVQLNTAVFAAMPSASVITTTAVSQGVFANERTAYFRSENIALTPRVLPAASPRRIQDRRTCQPSPRRISLHLLIDDTAVEEVHRSCRLARKARIVGHHDDGGAALMQLAQEIHHGLTVV